jgi:hypothetical protein
MFQTPDGVRLPQWNSDVAYAEWQVLHSYTLAWWQDLQ